MSLPPCGCKTGCQHRDHPQFPAQRECRAGIEPTAGDEPMKREGPRYERVSVSWNTGGDEVNREITWSAPDGFGTVVRLAPQTAVVHIHPDGSITLEEWADEG